MSNIYLEKLNYEKTIPKNTEHQNVQVLLILYLEILYRVNI